MHYIKYIKWALGTANQCLSDIDFRSSTKGYLAAEFQPDLLATLPQI